MAFAKKLSKPKVMWMLTSRPVLPEWAYTGEEWKEIKALPPLMWIKIKKRIKDG